MRSLLFLILLISLPTPTIQAQMTASDETTEIRYGLSNLQFNIGPVREVKIDRQARQKVAFSLVTTAQASDVTDEQLVRVCEAVNEARRVEDLQAVLSDNYYQLLKGKVDAGASQYIVLAALQSMRPQKIRIIDSHIDERHAELAVAGESNLGPMRGLVRLSKTGTVWKIDEETWFAGGKIAQQRKDPIVRALNSLPARNKYDQAKPSGLLSEVSPDYAVNRNFLSLAKVPKDRRRQAIMFVFMMNKDKDKAKAENEKDQDPFGRLVAAAPRARMHILWTGPKKMVPDQKVIENRYPMDVSIAKYEDGYAPGEWNMVMPSKKPREVRVSFLWSF